MLRNIRNNRIAPIAAAAIVCAAVSLAIFIPACDKETPTKPTGNLTPAAALVGQTGCKAYRAPVGSERAPSPDCFRYRLEDGHTLLIKHINAALNCCPGDITADIRIQNDTITIVERESQPGCHCLCLYDLDYRFENIGAGTYTIVFIEPYRNESDEPLGATIDLSASPSGEFCVERTAYPWTSGSGAEPYGVLVSRTDCSADITPAAGTPIVPGDMSCAEWDYSGAENVLRLAHVNAAFNCCPGEIAADIRMANDTITIVEHESQSMCDCSCLYTLRFEIRNLEPGTYAVRFVEPYAQPGDELLEFSVDLAALPMGMFCAFREHYPWGYQGTMDEDRAKLDAMRKNIVSLIGTASCGGDGDCRCIGLGAKPCGGVWEYLVYSASSVDEELLKYLVSRFNAYNEAFNRRYGVASDCMFVMPPAVGCVGGACRAIKTGP
jgi:hypothetical protein